MVDVFPTLSGIVYPVKRSPIWSTASQVTIAGRRTTQQFYTYPRYRYEVAFSFLRTATANKEWQTLLAFINRMGGAAGLFGFTDPDDSTVTDQVLGTGTGSQTQYQLVRTLTGNSPNTFAEPVWLPNGTPTIKINGTPTVLFSVSSTGLITFNSAPALGAALTWTGSYYWPCRFDEDINEFEKFASGFFEMKKLGFTTEKL